MSKRKINFMSLLEDYFETYLPYSRGLSSNTINSYKHSFLLLMRFMLEIKGIVASNIKFSDLTYETLLDSLTGWKLIVYASRQHEIRDYQHSQHFRSMHKTEILMQHQSLEVLS